MSTSSSRRNWAEEGSCRRIADGRLDDGEPFSKLQSRTASIVRPPISRREATDRDRLHIDPLQDKPVPDPSTAKKKWEDPPTPRTIRPCCSLLLGTGTANIRPELGENATFVGIK